MEQRSARAARKFSGTLSPTQAGNANATTIGSGGTQLVAEGIALGTVVNSGALQKVSAGGIIIGSPLVAYAAATTVSSGGTLLIATGTGSGVAVASGAQVVIGQGGVLEGAVVDNGTLTFSGGGFSGSLTGGGSLSCTQFVNFTLNGPQSFAGAVTVKGGTLILNGADTISGAVTVSGGALVVNGAETFGSAINISAATLEIGSSGTAGAVPIILAGVGNTLQIDGATSASMPTNTISGLAPGDSSTWPGSGLARPAARC